MNVRTWLLLTTLVLCLVEFSSAKPNHSNKQKTHEILTKIGFSKIRAPSSHHRKRLAVESRQHSRSDDSHMYVIKLPPNQHYYIRNKPNSLPVEHKQQLPVGFKNNGKPAKIYHWNMPILKRMASKKRMNNNKISRIDFKGPNSWNDVLDKPEKPEKTVFKKQSFYVPTRPKKSSFFKYFPGNGKPKSFYVIEKSKKKAHYHKLLP